MSKKMRRISAKRQRTLKNRKGFGFDTRKPSNTSIRDLLGSEIFADAVLALPRDTRVGIVKEEVLNKG